MVKTVLKIDGMQCGMCEAHMNDAIRNNFNVKKVNSSHAKGETVIMSEDALDEQALKQTVEKTGYQLTNISSEPYQKSKLFSFAKK